MAFRNAKDFFSKKPPAATPAPATVTVKTTPEQDDARKKEVEEKRKTFENFSKGGGRISQGAPNSRSEIGAEKKEGDPATAPAPEGETAGDSRVFQPRKELRRANSLMSNPFVAQEKERRDRRSSKGDTGQGALERPNGTPNSIHEARLKYAAQRTEGQTPGAAPSSSTPATTATPAPAPAAAIAKPTAVSAASNSFTVHFGKDDRISVPFSARRELRGLLQEIATAKSLSLNDFAAFSMSGDRIADLDVMLGELGTLSIQFLLKESKSPVDRPKSPMVESKDSKRNLTRNRDKRTRESSEEHSSSGPGSVPTLNTASVGKEESLKSPKKGLKSSKGQEEATSPRLDNEGSKMKSPRPLPILNLGDKDNNNNKDKDAHVHHSSSKELKKLISPRGQTDADSGAPLSPRRRPSGWNAPVPRADEADTPKEGSKDGIKETKEPDHKEHKEHKERKDSSRDLSRVKSKEHDKDPEGSRELLRVKSKEHDKDRDSSKDKDKKRERRDTKEGKKDKKDSKKDKHKEPNGDSTAPTVIPAISSNGSPPPASAPTASSSDSTISPMSSPRIDENDPNLTDEQRKTIERRKRIEDYKRKKAEEAHRKTIELEGSVLDEGSQRALMEKLEKDAREKAAKEAQEIAERVEREAREKAEEVLKTKLDADKLVREKRDREEKEEKEKRDREDKERKERDKKEKEEKLKEKEKKEKEDKERKEKEAKERTEREEKLRKEKEEKAKKDKEERERKEREDRERREREERERKERERQERQERERKEKEEKERKEREEKERLEKEEMEKAAKRKLPKDKEAIFAAAQAAHQLARAPKEEVEGSESEGDPLEKAHEGIASNNMAIVDLKMEGLDDEAMADLFQRLEKNGSVHTLALDGNEMEATSLIALNKLLTSNETLHSLSLNFIMFGELGSRTFAPGLAANQSLTYLSVSGNDLFEKGMEALAEGLKANTSVTTVILSENSISDGGCEALEKLMAVNQTITALDLSNNYINEDGGRHLGRMLLANHSLKHLNLERNSLGDEGVQGFSEGLGKNASLEKLSLGNNIIDVTGVVALAEALKENTVLDYIDVRQNIFDTEGDVALVEVLLDTRAKGRRLNVEWKKAPAKNAKPMSKSEMDVIIRHFTPSRLLDIYASGENLFPLIDIELLLVHMNYSESELEKLWALAFPPKKTTSNFHPPLALLVKVMHSKVEDEKLMAETAQEEGENEDEAQNQQFTITRFVANRIGSVSPKLSLKDSKERLGFNRFQITQLVRLLTLVSSSEVSKPLLATRALELSADLFFAFPIHSVFQHEFSTMLTGLIASSTPSAHELLSDLFIRAKFIDRLIRDFEKEVPFAVGKRSPHFGHLYLIANQCKGTSANDSALATILSQCGQWPTFAEPSGLLAKVTTQQSIPEALKPKPEDYVRKPSAFVGDATELPEKKKDADGNDIEEDEEGGDS